MKAINMLLLVVGVWAVIDGTSYGNSSIGGGNAYCTESVVNNIEQCNFHYITKALTAAAHTVSLNYSASAGTCTIYAMLLRSMEIK